MVMLRPQLCALFLALWSLNGALRDASALSIGAARSHVSAASGPFARQMTNARSALHVHCLLDKRGRPACHRQPPLRAAAAADDAAPAPAAPRPSRALRGLRALAWRARRRLGVKHAAMLLLGILAVVAPAKKAIAGAAAKAVAAEPTLQQTGVEVVNTLRDGFAAVGGARRDSMLLLLATAGVVPLCKRIKFSPILGFLLAGLTLGPSGLGLVNDVHMLERFADLGIVFFLFEMGLELSVSRLWSMRRDVFGLGMAQFLLTSVAIASVAAACGVSGPASVVVGGGLALSSSAFVLQLLRDKGELGTRHGRAAFGILLFQDLAVVPLLVVTQSLATAGAGAGISRALTLAAVKAAMALSVIAVFGKRVLDRIFHFVAKSKSQEAFLASILLTVLGTSVFTEAFGLSDTLGPFLAGVLLSETKYRYQVEADVAPFRGLLLGLFFMTVGFGIDLNLIAAQPLRFLGLVGGMLGLKALVIAALCLVGRVPLSAAQQTGALLSQGGEFAFVAFGMASRLGLMDHQLSSLLLNIAAVSMATTPLAAELSSALSKRIEAASGFSHYVGKDRDADALREESTAGETVVVCGYGRIGRMVCDLLDEKLIRYVAFDIDPAKAIAARNKGLPVFFGDVSRPEVLRSFNIADARLVVVALSDKTAVNKSVINLRRAAPNVRIYARAVDAPHRDRLRGTLEVEADVPIRPEDNAVLSLPFGASVLKCLGVEANEVEAMIETERRKLLRSGEALSEAAAAGEEEEGEEGEQAEEVDAVLQEGIEGFVEVEGGAVDVDDAAVDAAADGEDAPKDGQAVEDIVGGVEKRVPE